jgi:Pyruvate/2-oxoacid:ferredoxin oxidoreductase delta subunit
MMKTAADKSQYEKLYLIQPEIYNRVVPKLNEVEKQELKDLNEKNSNSNFQEDEETLEEKNGNNEGINVTEGNFQEDEETLEEKNDNNEGINVTEDVIMDQPPENIEEPKTDKPKISVKLVKNSNGKWSVKKTPLKKVKNFSCKICVNKSYTTRRSLERHNNSFHVKKHSIKGAEVIPEVIYPKTASPETVKSEERKTLKRKHQYHPGEFRLEKDNQEFSKDEPEVKRLKGVDSKVPKREKVKRKYQNDTNDVNKKFIWESY